MIKRSPSVLASFCLLALMSCASSGAGPETSKYAAQQAELDKRVPDLLSQFDVPAVGIAVATPEGVALAATYGDARPGLPATNDTLFNVASVSKILAAETVLRVAASGAFDLDAPMAPAWVDPDLVEDPRHRDLTPRHALAHQTGFPNWRSMNEDGRLVFRFDPGTQPGYSGEGFEYVARFIERTTDKTYPDIVSELVLKPSKAERIAFNNKSRWAPDFAWSKDSEGNFKPAETAPSWSAADDLYTTPTAFSRFLIPLLKGRSLPAELETDRRTIQFDMTKQFCSRPGFADICPQAIGFGLSGVVFEYEAETVLWQGGGDVGERAVAFYVPEKEIAVVVFTNGANGAKLFAPIAELFYDNQKYVEFLRAQGEQG